MHSLVFLIACVVLAEARIPDLGKTVINSRLKKKFTDCVDLRVNGGFKESGLYHIYPNTTKPVKVACRFELNNTFTSIMGQKDGSESFTQYFNSYIHGFGVVSTNNFWLGLDNIKRLTDMGHVNMRITMQDWSYVIKEIYYKFSLGSYPYYQAYFSYYQGPVGFPDDFSYNNAMPFATRDHVDKHGCAAAMLVGWWYNSVYSDCTYALPTGRYYHGPYHPVKLPDGIYYKDWHGAAYSLMYIRIDLAPNP